MSQAKIEIFDQLGRLVYTKNNIDLNAQSILNVDLKHSSHGIYLVKISNKNSSYNQRFIVE